MTEGHRPDTEKISALASGELDATETAAIRGTIDADAELRADYESLLATASLVSTTPTARAPRNYSTSLPPVSIAPWWMRWSPTLLATAAVALIAFALIDLQGPRLARADRSSVVTELEIALAVASPSDSSETAGSALVAAAPNRVPRPRRQLVPERPLRRRRCLHPKSRSPLRRRRRPPSLRPHPRARRPKAIRSEPSPKPP